MEYLNQVAPASDLTCPLTDDPACKPPIDQISTAGRWRYRLELGVLLLIGLIGWLTLAGLLVPIARQCGSGLA